MRTEVKPLTATWWGGSQICVFRGVIQDGRGSSR